MTSEPLHLLTASAALARLRAGTLTVEAYAQALLARIAERDGAVRAWAYLDKEFVLNQARALDNIPVDQRGPLHGLPVGIKDVIYTKDMPTQHNSSIYKGHFPSVDAASVTLLRHAGALIFGKTATTEFAATTIGPFTRNPHSADVDRTPGGSSSGSGASVGDAQIPLALATQTGGSTIRPASFNGIYALKPTWGAVSREGQKVYSLLLDTLGWYARSVADLELLADVFGVTDDEDIHPPHVNVNGNPSLSSFPSNGINGSGYTLRSARFAICHTPSWSAAGPGTITALHSAANILRSHGATVDELVLPPAFSAIAEWHRVLLHTDGLANFLPEHRTAKEQLHESLAVYIDMPEFTRKEQLAAQDGIAALRPKFDEIAEGYDAVLAPSAVDEAPVGLGFTGDAIFCAMWTALHVPVVNIPGFQGDTGMPIGVSLVAPRFRDRHLLRVAAEVGKVFESEGGWTRRLD